MNGGQAMEGEGRGRGKSRVGDLGVQPRDARRCNRMANGERPRRWCWMGRVADRNAPTTMRCEVCDGGVVCVVAPKLASRARVGAGRGAEPSQAATPVAQRPV
jgi:hypothetical protein